MNLDTLAAPASHQIEVKHSRFLAQAIAVESADVVAQTLSALCDTDATHHCWAWRIGDHYRSSDDGEPAGTAGRPILAAIDGQAYDQVLVVVTRWYGGIKLGAGGLVRAYGGVTAECLRSAQRKALIAHIELEIFCEFADLGAVHLLLNAACAHKLDERFDTSGAHLRVSIVTDRVDDLKNRLRDATRDRARVDLSV